MAARKQLLRPVEVPWQISPSVPHLKLRPSDDRSSFVATFIGYFKAEELVTRTSSEIVKVGDPGEFRLSASAHGAPHRMVRVQFENVVRTRTMPAVSDHELVAESDYDWSLVPTGIQGSESAPEAVARVDRVWRTQGICPDPAMYEVEGSEWIVAIKADPANRHYLLLGHDEYVEVVAKGWRWEPGQEVL